MHISISTRSGAGGLRRLPLLKYYDVLEWESEFPRMDAEKNTDYIKKFFKQNLLELNFLQKIPNGRISLSLSGV